MTFGCTHCHVDPNSIGGIFLKNLLRAALIGAVVFVNGCAEYPDRIKAAYIPSIIYNGASCYEITRERGRLVNHVKSIAAQQKRTANRDATAVTVSLITPIYIAWAGLAALPFSVDQSAQLAVARGHYNALVQAGQDAGCWGASATQPRNDLSWKRYPGDFPPL